MDLAYQTHLPANFSPNSRVWVYQSNRLFQVAEALQIEEILESFIVSWNSHGRGVKGYANLFFGRFIVFIADEATTGVSGCSTDSSVQVIREIEKKFNVSLLDRQNLAFWIQGKIEIVPLQQFSYAFENKLIKPSDLYFNNLVNSKLELETKWLIPVSESWLARKYLTSPL